MTERAFNKIRDGLLEALTLGGGAPDPRDARIADLEAEAARLREENEQLRKSRDRWQADALEF